MQHKIHFSISSPIIFLGVPYGIALFFLFAWITSLPILKILAIQKFALFNTAIFLLFFLLIRYKSKNNPYWIGSWIDYLHFFFHPENLHKKRYKYFFKKKIKFYG